MPASVAGRLRSPRVTVLTAVTTSVLVLFAAVGFGLQWPTSWWRSGPGDDSKFDYSTSDASFSPLRGDYLSEALGGGSGDDASGRALSGAPASARRGSRPKAFDTPVKVTHALTNDDFERAYNVPSLPFAAQSDTAGATRQTSEPADCVPAGGTSWYRYRAPADVALFADTFGTGAPVSLAVYTGGGLERLQRVGCDTNVLGNAQVGFRAAAGVMYWFQLTATVRGGPTVFELAAVGPTTVESLSPSGAPADAGSFDHPDVSADGRYVAFGSYARNLAVNAPECPDAPSVCETLYLRDRLTGTTTAIAAQGSPSPKDSWSGIPFLPSLSADGRYLSFSAYSFPLLSVPGPPDTDLLGYNTFLYDRVAGRIELVSRNSAGEPARSDPVVNYGISGALPAGSFASSVSADGRYVVFNSDGANLGAPVERGKLNTYLRDRVMGTTRLISTDADGKPNHADNCAGIGRNVSRDGRYVAYMSTYGTGTDSLSVLGGSGPHGSNYLYLIYLWDGRTGRSRLVSKLPPGVKPQTAGNYCVGISADGRRVAWVSGDALVPEDTNGTPDVYAYEVATGRIQRASVTSAGEQTLDPNIEGKHASLFKRSVTLSADGRFVAFDSAASNLAPGAVGSTGNSGARPAGPRQVFLHDLVTGATKLVSVSSTGEPLPGESILPYISPDGNAVSFMNTDASGALNVVVHQLR